MDQVSLLFVCVLWAIVGQTLSQLSEADKQELLDVHNRLRSSVDPPATNMQTMVWDDNLAQAAQSVASECVNIHVARPSSQSVAGENTYVTVESSADDSSFFEPSANSSSSVEPSTNFSLTSIVESWYSERENYDYISGQCSGKCANYTQLVWADSNKLGCAGYNCTKERTSPNDTVVIRILLCHYEPAGNVKGKKPYKAKPTQSGADASLQPAASIVFLSALIAAIMCMKAMHSDDC